MLKSRVEEYYLKKDFNCAETTLHVINDAYHLGLKEDDFKLVGAYGGGFGCGKTCGALAGAMAAIGKMVIAERAHATEGFGDLCKAYVAAFEEKMGHTDCDNVKAVFNKGTETRCLAAVEAAADVFEAFANEHGLKPMD